MLAHAHLESGAEYHRTEEAGHVPDLLELRDEDDRRVGEADALIRLIERTTGSSPI